MHDAASLDAIWCCPRCRSSLSTATGAWECRGCGTRYQVIGEIPDFRLPGPSWIDFDDDRKLAAQLAASGASGRELVQRIFAARKNWTTELAERRTRQILEAPERLGGELEGWLRDAAESAGLLLDIGCGPGGFLRAAAARGVRAAGVDVSMSWLIAAKRLLEEDGRRVPLAAALGESLPLPDGSVGSAVALDVIEHVAEPSRFLAEIDRVVASGGRAALSTPNRFSLAAEPHVGVWGVGWLPRRWQQRYVERRPGVSYAMTRLLSAREIANLVAAHTTFRVSIVTPEIPREELRAFGRRRAALGRLYNAMIRRRALSPFFLTFGAFFRVTGLKR